MALTSLDEVRAFAAVADARSFTAAAARLGLTTNAISLRVQRIERGLGARLFVRTTRSVALTDEGRAFRVRAARILDEVEAAEADLQPTLGLRGTVRVAVPGAVATGPFLERLNALLQHHPDLHVQLRLVNGAVSPAIEGLDLSVVVGQLPESTFVGRLLGRATWVLAASPRYLGRRGTPRTPDDLSAHTCLRLLGPSPQSEWTLVDRQGRQVTVPVGGAFEADDSRTLGDAVYAGLGVGVRPAGECARAQRAGTLRRVLPNHRFQPLDVYAVLPKGRLGVPRVAACLDALRGAVAVLA